MKTYIPVFDVDYPGFDSYEYSGGSDSDSYCSNMMT
jgi:hypothetical protein